jgi:hypothetical protein
MAAERLLLERKGKKKRRDGSIGRLDSTRVYRFGLTGWLQTWI